MLCKAVIHDHNEVYKNGFKIINQEAKIHILEKIKKYSPFGEYFYCIFQIICYNKIRIK